MDAFCELFVFFVSHLIINHSVTEEVCKSKEAKLYWILWSLIKSEANLQLGNESNMTWKRNGSYGSLESLMIKKRTFAVKASWVEDKKGAHMGYEFVLYRISFEGCLKHPDTSH